MPTAKELSSVPFGSKPLLVWDPRRVVSAAAKDDGGCPITTLYKPHARANVTGLEQRGVMTGAV